MREAKGRNAEERLEPLIHVVRGQRVILDADLARLYGVITKALNQAVKRNGERFPEDFAFQLTIAEAACTKAVDSIGQKIEPVTNCDRFSAASGPTLATLGVHRAWGADGNQRTSQ